MLRKSENWTGFNFRFYRRQLNTDTISKLGNQVVQDTEVESAGERGVRYMSASKRVCTARKPVSDS
jgi:hypothetical protein